MKDNTKLIFMAAGAAAAYWYVTNYGPNGAAFNSAGQQIAVTWWQSWFGTTAVATTPVTTTPVTTGQTSAATTNTAATTSTATSTAVAPTGTPVVTPVVYQTQSDPVPSGTMQILNLSGATNTTMFNLDQWNYYYNQIYSPITPDQMTALTNVSPVGNQPMTIATYMAAIRQSGINAGLSGVGDASVLPAMMSFRRGTTGARMRGMKDYKSAGGVTIQ